VTRHVSEWTIRELEARILDGSGLGSHPGWGNGPGADHVRSMAEAKTHTVLQWLHMEGAPVALPESRLLAYIGAAAKYLDKEPWCLTRTWQVTSDVARAHLYMGRDPSPEARATCIASCEKVMESSYGLCYGVQRYETEWGALHGVYTIEPCTPTQPMGAPVTEQLDRGWLQWAGSLKK